MSLVISWLNSEKILKTATLVASCIMGLTSTVAQQPGGFRVSAGFGPGGHHGHGDHANGPNQANLLIPFTQLGTVQQPMGMGTSAATYSNGRMVSGVVRTPQGVVHLSNGLVVGPGEVVGPMGLNYGGLGVAGSFNGVPGVGWSGGLPAGFDPMGLPPMGGPGIPYGAPYPYGLPYFGGMNAYYPGSVLGSTLLNMSYSMRPSVPSTAVYTGPSLMFMNGLPLSHAPYGAEVPQIRDAPPAPAPERLTPLLNEFDACPRGSGDSSLADRINSLRYQSVGDDAFRNEDYRKALEAYRAGLDISPDRRALWIRMAFASVATEEFGEAASYLKTGLLTPSDATRAWITAEELYGERAGERARSHGSKLWNWLAEKPLSSDRLLLGGTFQKLRGFDGAAAELLQMASHEGVEAEYVATVMSLSEGDIGRRAVSQQLGQIIEESKRSKSAETVSGPGRTAPVGEASLPNGSEPDPDGIFQRGATDIEPATDPGTSVAEPQGLPLFIPKH